MPDPVARHQQTLASLLALTGCTPVERAGLVPYLCKGSTLLQEAVTIAAA